MLVCEIISGDVKLAYGTDQGLVDYLAATGRELPDGYSPAVARQFGTMYVNMWEDRYRGVAVQLPDSFPRDLWPVVPDGVEFATYEAAFAYASGVDIFGGGGSAGGQVTKERVDVLEVQYAAPQDGVSWWDANRFVLPLAYQYLLPFMKPDKCADGCKGGMGATIF